MTVNPAAWMMEQVSPGALQVQPGEKKVVDLLGNLRGVVTVDKQACPQTGQITLKLSAA
ncbi:hypothetical protein M1E08_17910 [Erwinia sp. PK3-005]